MWYYITKVLYVAIVGCIIVFTAMEIKNGVSLLISEIKEDDEKLRLEESEYVNENDVANKGEYME